MFRDKLKQFFKQTNEEQENSKKKIENIVFFIILLIITVVIINIIWNGKHETTKQENHISTKQLANSNTSVQNNDSVSENGNLEEKLQKILSKIQGVGEVEVLVSYSESSQVVAMYNENTRTSNTEESDTTGGVRKIQETDSQKDIIYQEENGEKTPITQKIIEPKVEGAIITAKGADNVAVKTNIIQAVESVTGLATHKIQVFEMD